MENEKQGKNHRNMESLSSTAKNQGDVIKKVGNSYVMLLMFYY